jgi:hypothetical protein
MTALMMEAARTSETSVDNYFTRQYIPEDNSEIDALSFLCSTDTKMAPDNMHVGADDYCLTKSNLAHVLDLMVLTAVDSLLKHGSDMLIYPALAIFPVSHHHHWLDSPTWALAFLRTFC